MNSGSNSLMLKINLNRIEKLKLELKGIILYDESQFKYHSESLSWQIVIIRL